MMDDDESLIIRLNGSTFTNRQETSIDISGGNIQLKHLLKESCTNFGKKEKYKGAVLYSKEGVKLF